MITLQLLYGWSWTIWDFPDNEDYNPLADIYEMVNFSSVCHGAGGLLNID